MTNPTLSGQVPDALRLAEYIDDLMDGSMVNYVIDDLEKAAAELRRLHAYCQELEAQVIRDCMTHVQNPAEIEHVAGDVSKNGAEVNTSAQQPAPAGATALSPTEQRWVLQSPAAIAQLLTFIDLDHSQAVSVLGAEECEPWPPKRYIELKEVGRKIIEQDPDCFDEETLRTFGFSDSTPQPTPAAGVTVEQVEDAIGLQSTAWDTIGAEKIVEAVLRLTNGQAPATQQAVSSAVLKAIREANMQLVRTGDNAFMLVPYKAATAQAAESVPAVLSGDELVRLGKSPESGLYPWGLGTTRADYLRAVHAVLAAARAPAESVGRDSGEKQGATP